MRRLNSILLVDDDSVSNFLNELLIKEMGVAKGLSIAYNGQEALDNISTHCIPNGDCPDLILLDINMPVVNGFGFLRKFNELEFENKRAIVIVMLSTSSNPVDREMALDLHVKEYLSKPLTKENLTDVLHRYFD